MFCIRTLDFDLYCDILFSEHVLTSSLFVSQLQLEVFHAPFVYLVSVNPTTFRDEPFDFTIQAPESAPIGTFRGLAFRFIVDVARKNRRGSLRAGRLSYGSQSMIFSCTTMSSSS